MGTEKPSALDIAAILRNEMPSIGFFSKSKRLSAYFFITARAEELAGADKALAMEALDLLSYLSKPFNISALVVAMNMERIPTGSMSLVGWDYANLVADMSRLPASEL